MESNWRWNLHLEGFSYGVWSLFARTLADPNRAILKQELPAPHNVAIYRWFGPVLGWVFEQQFDSALPFPFGFAVEPD